MKRKRLEPETLEAVAHRLKVLADPGRLAVLDALRGQPMSVTTLTDETGLNQANLSKQLQLLYAHGFVDRRREGSYVYYSLADRSVLDLCDLMCGQLKRHVAVRAVASMR